MPRNKEEILLVMERLAETGLFPLAVCALEPGELPSGLSMSLKHIALIGPIGGSLWPQFRVSREFVCDQAHPLDTWSKRVLPDAFKETEGEEKRLVFPSDGPPYLPFQRWAKRSGLYETSPLGIALHRKYGLWSSFRAGAFLTDCEVAAVKRCNLYASPEISHAHASVCESCEDKPCLQACPVGAFETDLALVPQYDVGACRQRVKQEAMECHLQQQKDTSSCFSGGCKARLACPLAADLHYGAEQFEFHMKAFG